MSTDARDELAEALRKEGAWCGGCDFEMDSDCPDCDDVLGRYADAILAAGWRKVDPSADTRTEKAEAALDRMRAVVTDYEYFDKPIPHTAVRHIICRCSVTPPRDLADAQARLDRIRDYAREQRRMAEELHSIDRPYAAIPYDNTAAALERIIGGQQ